MKKSTVAASLIGVIVLVTCVFFLLNAVYQGKFDKKPDSVVNTTVSSSASPEATSPVVDNHLTLNNEQISELVESVIFKYINISDTSVTIKDSMINVECLIDVDDVFTEVTGIEMPISGEVESSFIISSDGVKVTVESGTISGNDMPPEAISVIQSGLQKALLKAGVTKIEVHTNKLDIYGTNLDALVN